MAQSPSHKLGQIIGDVVEASVEPLLAGFAGTHGLYLDRKGPRPARRGKKVSWKDMYGNTHELDYVLERDGTHDEIGTPVAFIEVAYRRYTKHSRNKAQEIQGAVLPLKTTYSNVAPFIGAVLGGVFTDGALAQLRSRGFTVLYYGWQAIVSAFRRVGVDVDYDEDTPDEDSWAKVQSWEALSQNKQNRVVRHLRQIGAEQMGQFMAALEAAVTRVIELVRVLPLYGSATDCPSLAKAIQFIEEYDESDHGLLMLRYEIDVRYTNGDRIEAKFADKQSAIEFLRHYQPPCTPK